MSTSTRSAALLRGWGSARARDAALFVGGLAFAVAIHLWDPTTAPGPTCPFFAITGRSCPGCGTLRCLHALAHGHLGAAVDHNALTVSLLPVLVAAWASVGLAAILGRPPGHRRFPTWAGRALTVAIVAFWVLRNIPLPAFAWMAPSSDL